MQAAPHTRDGEAVLVGRRAEDDESSKKDAFFERRESSFGPDTKARTYSLPTNKRSPPPLRRGRASLINRRVVTYSHMPTRTRAQTFRTHTWDMSNLEKVRTLPNV